MPPRILGTKTIHDGFIRLLSARVALDDGTLVGREIEEHGRAVAVLPYDPARGTVILVRQLRAPVLFAAGHPDLLEAPAGLVDDDTPDDAARRELFEETGIRVHEVEPLGAFWPSPGLSTETIDLYVARYAATDRVGRGGGLADEAITIVELPIAEAWDLLARGELADMKTALLLHMLHARQPRLFPDPSDR